MSTTDQVDPGPPALELVGASIPSQHFRSRIVLENVHWQVRPGDFWVVGGLAHSGKTNLLMVAAGILRPNRGSYRLFGKDFSRGFENEHLVQRLKVGMVFDGGQLLQHLTLVENVALPLRYHASADDAGDVATYQRLAELVEFTGLRTSARSYPAAVNRNWQQRYGLARALALRPEVLLIDSPLSGMDPREMIWWLDTLGALAAGHPIVGRPLTLAVTGDDFRPWRKLARQFAVVREQAFVDVGTASNIELHPDPLLRDLLPSMGPGS